ELSTALVVAQRRARTIIGGRPLRAGAAEGAGAQLMCERQAAAGAAGLAQKGDLAPAGGAERVHRLDLLAAGDAARRKHEIEQRTAGPFERRGEHRTGMGPCSRPAVNCAGSA